MALNFKKNITIGIAVTPGFGLEVAQIDSETRTIVKYGKKNIDYNNSHKDIADIDIFMANLEELLNELEIPKGTDVSLSFPSVLFGVKDCPAAWNNLEIEQSIIDEIADNPKYQDMDFCIASSLLPNSTIQMNKVVYEGLSRTTLIEIAIMLQGMGYNIVNIDTSINTTLKALIYNNLIPEDPSKTWAMLLIDNNFARIIIMQGINYVDSYEEPISIGEVLGDEENYGTILEVTAPLIKNITTDFLYVISKTNVIKAKTLASKISSKATILHLDDNKYAEQPLLNAADDVTIAEDDVVTMDVVGAAITTDIKPYIFSNMNLFNKQLGEVFSANQPLSITFGGKEYILSVENMIKSSIIFGILLVAFFVALIIFLMMVNTKLQSNIDDLKSENELIQQRISKYNISTDEFNEGDEIRIGLVHNKKIYTYLQIIGTEIPKKLWLTNIDFSNYVTINGQANNLESVYGFFRNIRDYSPEDNLKLKKLGLASKNSDLVDIASTKNDGDEIKEKLMSSLNADFYQFCITNDPDDSSKKKEDSDKNDDNKDNNNNTSDKKIPDKDLMEDVNN